MGHEGFPVFVAVRPAAGAAPLRILAVDLPSDPRLPRARVADALAAVLARERDLPAPDLVLGDLNCTPGGVVFAKDFAALAPAPPWRARGWLPSFPRERPFWKIDAMLADPARLSWVRYRTLDLGTGAHKAQQGAFVAR